MAKIVRKLQKIFAGNATNNGQFGSAQTGAKVTSDDPDVIQQLTAWENGWNDATISGQRLPTLEEMQGIQYLTTRQLAYFFQEGIAEWDTDTTYYENGIVKRTGTYEVYGSKIASNQGNALPSQTDDANWQYLGDLAALKDAGTGTVLNNFIATTNPGVGDDSADGYSAGSAWLNANTNTLYRCVDASVGAAVWEVVPLSSNKGTTNQVLKSAGASSPASFSDIVTVGASVATTSGTTIDLTGIPSGTSIVIINLDGVSTNGTDDFLLQLIDSGGAEVTGYNCASSLVEAGGNTLAESAAGLRVVHTGTGITSGSFLLTKQNAGSNAWSGFGVLRDAGSGTVQSAGSKSLSGELTGIRLTTVGGTNSFDTGSANISYV